jgi:3-oxoacyl-[acyl-carrier protein] reductase
VAVVTGASKGIGAAIARQLAAAGAAVIVNYDSSREGAERVVKDITVAGGRAAAFRGNRTSSACLTRPWRSSGASTCWSTTPACTPSRRWKT